ncbi:hypothetical protein PR001_g2144 [Phytophthora rubi]|uniref:Uncharacterized protein n=1 Tax=Phytophthora rubi TaxID=129364 RepID=A0A6A3NEB6_9STRA|nr:hypothetical protein PR002_g4966 [Phytophthora rubi]KAE9050720.1 hypothetical protein PR001_g2144 [Phytophthora rubi]
MIPWVDFTFCVVSIFFSKLVVVSSLSLSSASISSSSASGFFSRVSDFPGTACCPEIARRNRLLV